MIAPLIVLRIFSQEVCARISMERAVELIKQNSRRYAKRQWTWFRHDESTCWFDYTDYPNREALETALLNRIHADEQAYLENA